MQKKVKARMKIIKAVVFHSPGDRTHVNVMYHSLPIKKLLLSQRLLNDDTCLNGYLPLPPPLTSMGNV